MSDGRTPPGGDPKPNRPWWADDYEPGSLPGGGQRKRGSRAGRKLGEWFSENFGSGGGRESSQQPTWGGTRYTGWGAKFSTPEQADPALAERNRYMGGIGGGKSALGGARGAQGEALDAYRDMIAGDGPSVAEQQLRAGQEENTRQHLRALAQGRGGNLASMSSRAGGAAAANALSTNQQAAQLRAGEQQAAMQGLASLSSTMADQGLTELGMYEGHLADMNRSLYEGELERELRLREMRENERNNRFNRGMGLAGAIGDTLGSIVGMAGMSDIRAKTGISKADPDVRAVVDPRAYEGPTSIADKPTDPRAYEGPTSIVQRPVTADPFDPQTYARSAEVIATSPEARARAAEAMESLEPYRFEYKKGLGQVGTPQVGIMAQDLEKSPEGRAIVRTGPDGLKRVDTHGLAGLAAAGSAANQEKVEDLEKKVKRLERKNRGLAGASTDDGGGGLADLLSGIGKSFKKGSV